MKVVPSLSIELNIKLPYNKEPANGGFNIGL